jgi:hypothetical protein
VAGPEVGDICQVIFHGGFLIPAFRQNQTMRIVNLPFPRVGTDSNPSLPKGDLEGVFNEIEKVDASGGKGEERTQDHPHRSD